MSSWKIIISSLTLEWYRIFEGIKSLSSGQYCFCGELWSHPNFGSFGVSLFSGLLQSLHLLYTVMCLGWEFIYFYYFYFISFIMLKTFWGFSFFLKLQNFHGFWGIWAFYHPSTIAFPFSVLCTPFRWLWKFLFSSYFC